MRNYFKLGSESIKGGILFGNLTPGGIFSNLPYQDNLDLFLEKKNNITNSFQNNNQDCDKKYLLTLSKMKESLENELNNEVEISEKLFKTFLSNSIQLLIDYNDVRNFIFYGSSYSELSYNILFLINNFTYQAFLSKKNITIPSGFLNYLSNNRTEILIKKSDILLGNEIYDLKEKENIDYTKFIIVDKEGFEYKIIDFENPIYNEINNITFNNSNTIIECINHNFITGDMVKIKLSENNKLNNIFYCEVISPDEIIIYEDRLRLKPVIINNALLFNEERIKKYVDLYTYTGDYNIRLVVEGNIPFSNLIQYKIDNNSSDIYYGIKLKRNKQYYFDFENNLSDFQKHLLNKSINKPWPRQVLTDNILFQGQEFEAWLTDTGNFQKSFNYEEDGYGAYTNELNLELSITSALYLDEEWTNQILRKTLPHYLIDELRDSEGLFKRLILMMAWFWDQLRLYINFISYNHHLNYTSYNQLTYKFYDLYAKHFGFNLFEEDNIELSRLLIKTEPGLLFKNNLAFSDEQNSKTLFLLQKEKQKRLLINLLFLYKKKGTLDGLEKLINLLGVPNDLIITNEYYLDFLNKDEFGVPTDNLKVKRIKNNKIITPEIIWTKNFDKLKVKNLDEIQDTKNLTQQEINNKLLNLQENQPFFYDIKSKSEYDINLRDIDLLISPQDALNNDIVFLNKKKYDLVEIQHGGFFNLQNRENNYYLLPLSIPDKFSYFSLNILINKESMLQYNRIDLCSLFLVNSSNTTNIELNPKGNKYNYFIERFGYYNKATFDIEVYNNSNLQIISNGTIIFNSILPYDTDEENKKFICNKININNLNYKSVIEDDKVVIYSKSFLLNNLDLQFIYNSLEINIFNNTKFTNTLPQIQNDFIICRIENGHFVFRSKLHSEINNSLFYDIVAKSKYKFEDDGLLHNYKFLLNNKGVELYKDFQYIETVYYRDALTAPSSVIIPQYDSRICPYDEIELCDLFNENESLNNLCKKRNNENEIRLWDFFIGDPRNIKVNFNQVGFFECRDINQDSLINIAQENLDNYNSEGYIFKPNEQNNNFDAYFSPQYPLIDNEDTSHYLPYDNDNKVYNLNLINYENIDRPNKFLNIIQDFYKNILEKEDILKNSWEKNLHKQNQYNVYKNVIENYYIFNKNIIYYTNLLPMIDIIERKFIHTAQQFIPVVVNTNKFSKLIQPENNSKYRYENAFKICNIQNNGMPASIEFELTGLNNEVDENDSIKIIFEDLGEFEQNWDTDLLTTLTNLGEKIKNNLFEIDYKIIGAKLIIYIDQLWYYNLYNKNVYETNVDVINTINISFINYNWLEGTNGNGVISECFQIQLNEVNNVQSISPISFLDENDNNNYQFWEEGYDNEFNAIFN